MQKIHLIRLTLAELFLIPQNYSIKGGLYPMINLYNELQNCEPNDQIMWINDQNNKNGGY
jgi:hypothetical protein